MHETSKRTEKQDWGIAPTVSWPLYCSDMGNSTVRNLRGFSGGSVVKKKESTCSAGDLQEMWVRSLDQEDPLEKEMATHSSILALKKPMDRGVRLATVHGIAKSQT